MDKSSSFLLKINMLSLLLEEIKNLKNKNKSDELYIFINNSVHESPDLHIINEEKFLKNNVVAIVIGGDYEFKKLNIQEKGIYINLANENGDFIKNYLPYDNIIGFYKNKTFIKSQDLLYKENINLSEIEEYKKNFLPLIKDKEKNSSINYLINEIIKNNILSLLAYELEKNEVIKITFFEKNLEDMEKNSNNSYKAKLLVVLIEDDSWDIKIEDDSIILTLKDEKTHENEFKTIHIPINNIVTYLDTKNSLLFNRYVKIIWEDFEDIDLTIYEKENLVFIDFNTLLEEESTSNFSSIFNIPNIFLKNDGNKKNLKDEDNLIMGNFNNKDEEE